MSQKQNWILELLKIAMLEYFMRHKEYVYYIYIK